jgi:hypothetical protein
MPLRKMTEARKGRSRPEVPQNSFTDAELRDKKEADREWVFFRTGSP